MTVQELIDFLDFYPKNMQVVDAKTHKSIEKDDIEAVSMMYEKNNQMKIGMVVAIK